MIDITKASTDDIPVIKGMSSVVFRHTYSTILDNEQIEYMMEWMYSKDSLLKQFSEGDVFFIAFKENIPCGYMSIHHEESIEVETDIYHLQKLYVMPTMQGNGIGKLLLETAFNYARENKNKGRARIELNVNRNNKAVGFYKRMGMNILYEGDFPIGNGYYMNDYIMSIDIV